MKPDCAFLFVYVKIDFEKTGTLRERVELSAIGGLPLFRIFMCAGRSFKHK
jgi:hypothetical protein